jgi:hypothetical protein
MHKKAIEAARLEFARADEAIQFLGASHDFSEVETHWARFLTAASRVYTKLEQGAKGHPHSAGWYSTKVHQRRTQPLLSYIWHARNADEHTLQDVTQQVPATVKHVAPTIADLEVLARAKAQSKLPMVGLALIEVTPTQVRLLPVKDRGRLYSPPHEYPTPLQAGINALAALEAMLFEADGLVVRRHLC